MYVEASVIVAGGLDEIATFTDETLMNDWLAGLEEESQNDGYRYEVYTIYHDHKPGDCECVQYLTDHLPSYVFNEDGNI